MCTTWCERPAGRPPSAHPGRCVAPRPMAWVSPTDPGVVPSDLPALWVECRDLPTMWANTTLSGANVSNSFVRWVADRLLAAAVAPGWRGYSGTREEPWLGGPAPRIR